MRSGPGKGSFSGAASRAIVATVSVFGGELDVIDQRGAGIVHNRHHERRLGGALERQIDDVRSREIAGDDCRTRVDALPAANQVEPLLNVVTDLWRSSAGWTQVWRIVVAIVGLATPVLAYYGTLHPYPPYPFDRQVTFAAISVGLVAVWFAYLRLTRPDRVRAAAAHARTHHGVPPLDEELDYTPATEPGRIAS